MSTTEQDATGLAPQSVLTQIQTTPKHSVFDAHHAPEPAVMDKCVHCGFCLPACPTYVLWGEEMDSPRGRIWLMRKGTLGEAPLDATFQKHIDNCLGCMACMTACPSGVEYNKLIEDTRGQIERHTSRSISERIFRRILFATFPHPRRLRVLGLALALYQRSALQRLVRASGLLKLLPKRLQAMEALLPSVPLNPFHSLPRSVSPRKQTRGRVGMLTGCVQDAYFAHVNAATARVLAAEGFEIVIPRSQPCCGALMVHSGLERDAEAYAKRIIALFEAADVDSVVINAAGCGSTMKEYGHLLRDDPAWAARAAAFSAKCRDISEVLAAHEPLSPRSPLPLRIAYHDACHLRHAQSIWQQPRTLLGQIPGLAVEEIAEATLCCGSAGVYNLLHPEPANELGDRKVEHLLATGAQAVVSANPGCLLQLMAGLRRRGLAELPAFHMVELLDASIRGLTVDQLLHGRRSLDVDSAPALRDTNLLTEPHMTGPDELRLTDAANALLDARRTNQPLPDLPANLQPQTLDEAYAIQDRVAAGFGDIGGWKIGAPSPDATPMYAPMPVAWIVAAPTTLTGERWRYRGLEAEIAFLVGQDLPPRATPYSREEVIAAMASCHPAIELLEPAFNDPAQVPRLASIADLQMHGGFVYGPAVTKWQSIDFTKEKVTLIVDGVVRVERTGSNTAGDLLRLLPWLANEGAARTGGLRKGQWITTGSWTGNTPACESSAVEVLFSTAGRVDLRFG